MGRNPRGWWPCSPRRPVLRAPMCGSRRKHCDLHKLPFKKSKKQLTPSCTVATTYEPFRSLQSRIPTELSERRSWDQFRPLICGRGLQNSEIRVRGQAGVQSLQLDRTCPTTNALAEGMFNQLTRVGTEPALNLRLRPHPNSGEPGTIDNSWRHDV